MEAVTYSGFLIKFSAECGGPPATRSRPGGRGGPAADSGAASHEPETAAAA